MFLITLSDLTDLVDIKPVDSIHNHPWIITQLMRSFPLNVWSWAAVEQGAVNGGKPFISEELAS